MHRLRTPLQAAQTLRRSTLFCTIFCRPVCHEKRYEVMPQAAPPSPAHRHPDAVLQEVIYGVVEPVMQVPRRRPGSTPVV